MQRLRIGQQLVKILPVAAYEHCHMALGKLLESLAEAEALGNELRAKLGAPAAVQCEKPAHKAHCDRDKHRRPCAGKLPRNQKRQRARGRENHCRNIAEVVRARHARNKNAQGDPCQHTQKQDQSPRGHVRQQLAHDGKRRDAGCNRAQRLHDFDVAA